ncbi:hypothetical protein QUF70_13970 [Desulfobacterales bacterium HSG17]|nr:hypothetical protein [Desulfobacterales bacterium HSG17]
MLYWNIRERLSPSDRLRRSYYELLRDELDQFMVKYSLIDSYKNFIGKKIPYPFVEKRELKPRAIIPDFEYEAQNAFLVVFVEDSIPNLCKKYIRFFDVNKTTKANLLRTKTLPLSKNFDRYQKYLESAHFFDFLNVLLPVDYALLIQRDPAIKRTRYRLSHFHVRIDWPIADAAEDMARNLRYISKDLYEKGDKYAEDVQKKFFEYYGLPVMVGGRRTAACVAAQFLKQTQCITTVYAGSSETRALIRLSERGVTKMVLMKLDDDEIKQLVENKGINIRSFKENYVVAREGKSSICIFQTIYSHTNHARPPEDGKLREIKPDLSWLSVGIQQIVPVPGIWEYPPIEYNVIYS